MEYEYNVYKAQTGIHISLAIIDWYSRYVLSWEISTTLDKEFCMKALNRALESGKPEIFNTDQGVPFTSLEFTGRLEDAGIKISPDVLESVYKDLTRDSRTDTGRTGMTAEQVLRSAILKQYRNLTYEELEFHLEDSKSFRCFARLDMGQYPVSSVLQDNIKCISEGTWETINRILIRSADKDKTEKGRKVRIDATAVETNIHTPSDSTLLCDGVRIITRWLENGQELNPMPTYEYSDHNRVMKKRFKKILNSKKEETRKAAYKDLIHYAGIVCKYAEDSIVPLSLLKGNTDTDTIRAVALRDKIEKALDLLKRVIDQTERRVFKGEKVPANEKVVSFFEAHTDISRHPAGSPCREVPGDC